MKNTQVCKSCGTENPFYVSTCKKCNFIIRDKIVNIDLWSAIARLLENPVIAFRSIIQAEHKNFVVSIILFASVKFSIDTAFLSMLLYNRGYEGGSIFSNLILAIILLVIILFLYSFIIKIITKASEAKTRLKDNLAVFTYSIMPHSLALCIVFPIEIAVFGANMFSTNPSPFLLKPPLAYILSGFEVLIFIWSIFLAVVGMYSQTRSKAFGISAGLIFNILLLSELYFLSVSMK